MIEKYWNNPSVIHLHPSDSLECKCLQRYGNTVSFFLLRNIHTIKFSFVFRNFLSAAISHIIFFLFLSIHQRVPSGSLAALECTLIFSNFPRRAPQILWSEPQLADEKEQSYLPYMNTLSAAAPLPSNRNNTAPIGLQNTMEVYVDKVKKNK